MKDAVKNGCRGLHAKEEKEEDARYGSSLFPPVAHWRSFILLQSQLSDSRLRLRFAGVRVRKPETALNPHRYWEDGVALQDFNRAGFRQMDTSTTCFRRHSARAAPKNSESGIERRNHDGRSERERESKRV